MSENRCLRCNRKLSDPNARYGWRCAEIMQKEGLLNYAGDNSFDAFMDGIRLADEFLLKHGIDPGKIDLSAFYQASIKCLLAEGMGNEELVEQALAEAEQALSPQRDAQGNPISTPRLPLEEYIRLRDNFDYQNGSFTTDRYLGDTPSAQILAAQELLNSLGAVNRFGDFLKADGLFGPNTQWALDGIQLLGDISKGGLIGSEYSQYGFYPSNGSTVFGIMDKNLGRIRNGRPVGAPVIRIDGPHKQGKINYPHINFDNVESYPFSNPQMIDQIKNIDHSKIPKSVYNFFNGTNKAAKVVKSGGKAMAVLGIALDAYDLYNTINDDLNDEDGRIGKKTVSTAVGIGGSWAGGAAGAKLGAMGGAAIGSIFPGPGTIIGGFVGSLLGGVIGSIGGRLLGDLIE